MSKLSQPAKTPVAKPAKTLAAEPTGPLKNIRIIDLTGLIFGAYATQMLGDLGADVIKIEAPATEDDPGGDIVRWNGPSPGGTSTGLGPLFMPVNRNKRSVLLDLKKPKPRAALFKLIEPADIFISTIRYGALERLGLSYEEIRTVKPDIIYIHGAGYGAGGAYANLPAYDDLMQAASGMADLLPRTDGDPAPRYLPTIIADKVSGMQMANAALAALVHRGQTGEGQFIEVPMFETTTAFLLTEHLYGHVFDPPTGDWGYSRALSPDRRPYQTKDGYIAILSYTDKQWDAFFELAGRPGFRQEDPRFTTYQARAAHVDELYAMIESFTITKTTAQWLELLRGRDIPAMPVNRLDQLMDDPHLQSIGFFAPYDHPVQGRYYNMPCPVKFAASPASIHRHAPVLGADTYDVLREAGLSEAEIDDALGQN